MFEQTFVAAGASHRSPWAVGVSLTLQCAGVGLALLLPLLRVAQLTMPDPPAPRIVALWTPPTPASVRTSPATANTPSLAAPRLTQPFRFPVVGRSIASTIAMPVDDAGAIESSGPTTMPFTSAMPVGLELPTAIHPQTPTPVTQPHAPLRISSGAEAAKLIYGPKPEYPRLALVSRTQGTVRLAALIGEDGSIRNLRVVVGSPLLVPAALDAVRQWKYQPTSLNGQPVEVETEIEVNFTLSH